MVADRFSKINNICLVVITGIAITVALHLTRSALVPFVISVFVYGVFSPSIKWFQYKMKLPRYLSVILNLFLFIMISTILILYVISSLEQFINSASLYKQRVIDFIQWLSQFLSKYHIQFDNHSINNELKDIPVFKVAKTFTGGILTILGNSVLVIIIVIFFVLGEGKQKIQNQFVDEIQKKISRYLITKFLTSLMTGIMIGFLLVVCRVDFALMFGILTIFFNFIPSIGSILATILPIPVLLLQFGFAWQFYVVLALSSLIQFTIGNILEPKFLGDSMDLHPVSVVIFLIFWGVVWGLPGMFLAVPITAIVRIILSRIEATQPLSEILAGRIPQNQ